MFTHRKPLPTGPRCESVMDLDQEKYSQIHLHAMTPGLLPNGFLGLAPLSATGRFLEDPAISPPEGLSIEGTKRSRFCWWSSSYMPSVGPGCVLTNSLSKCH